MFKKLGYNVCFVSLNDLPESILKDAIRDKYYVEEWDDMYFFSFKGYFKKLLPISCNVLFTTSIYSAANIIVKPILMGYKKMILIHETVYDDPLIIEAFGKSRYLNKILMLGDMRTFDVLGNYEHLDYRRKLYFDIWKPLVGDVDKRIMLNMSTEQKCYDVGYIKDLMRFYQGEYLIYTRQKFYDKYRVLDDGCKVKVEVSPIPNFMNRWDTALYLNSKRGQDPSPRVIAECKWYGKNLFWHRQGELQDGAYYRNIDVLNGLDNLKLTGSDPIFEIVERYL